MRELIRTPVTPIWAGLMLATGYSWWVGADDSAGAGDASLVTVSILIVAFAKVHFVGMHFMELRHAPAPLRLMFHGWYLVFCVAMVLIYLVA